MATKTEAFEGYRPALTGRVCGGRSEVKKVRTNIVINRIVVDKLKKGTDGRKAGFFLLIAKPVPLKYISIGFEQQATL